MRLIPDLEPALVPGHEARHLPEFERGLGHPERFENLALHEGFDRLTRHPLNQVAGDQPAAIRIQVARPRGEDEGQPGRFPGDPIDGAVVLHRRQHMGRPGEPGGDPGSVVEQLAHRDRGPSGIGELEIRQVPGDRRVERHLAGLHQPKDSEGRERLRRRPDHRRRRVGHRPSGRQVGLAESLAVDDLISLDDHQRRGRHLALGQSVRHHRIELGLQGSGGGLGRGLRTAREHQERHRGQPGSANHANNPLSAVTTLSATLKLTRMWITIVT